MFQYSRQKVWKDCDWEPRDRRPICYLDAFKTTAGDFFRTGRLLDNDIKNWVALSGSFSLPSHLTSEGLDKIKGGLRVLFFERSSSPYFSVSISSSSYEHIESEFSLHPATLTSFKNFNGICAQFSKYSSENPRAMDKISTSPLISVDKPFQLTYPSDYILKATQKKDLANYGLSLTHDFSTSITTAIICGTYLIRNHSTMVHPLEGQLSHIQDFIENTSEMWLQPALLPSIILYDYTMRLKRHCTQSHGYLTNAEGLLGVSKSGKLARHELASSLTKVEWDTDRTRRTIRLLTEDLATRKTEVIYLMNCCEWASHCVSFLQKAVTHLRDHALAVNTNGLDMLSDIIEFQASEVATNNDFISKQKDRAELQLDILYSFIAQNDNKLNARAAAAVSRDSMAMKVLALITALFLPGSFVAALFSMDMFNWRPGPQHGPETVSPQFWIYWVISVPLTFMVVLIWRLWWSWENERFKQEVGIALEQADSRHTLLEKSRTAVKTTREAFLSWRGVSRKHYQSKEKLEDA